MCTAIPLCGPGRAQPHPHAPSEAGTCSAEEFAAIKREDLADLSVGCSMCLAGKHRADPWQCLPAEEREKVQELLAASKKLLRGALDTRGMHAAKLSVQLFIERTSAARSADRPTHDTSARARRGSYNADAPFSGHAGHTYVHKRAHTQRGS